jgi:hypothetical protein
MKYTIANQGNIGIAVARFVSRTLLMVLAGGHAVAGLAGCIFKSRRVLRPITIHALVAAIRTAAVRTNKDSAALRLATTLTTMLSKAAAASSRVHLAAKYGCNHEHRDGQ